VEIGFLSSKGTGMPVTSGRNTERLQNEIIETAEGDGS
jgi:hypothetical protein